MRKFWLTLSLLIFYVPCVMGASIHYDSSRPGEGITVTESLDNGLSWILFTHMNMHEPEVEIGDPIPPVVSPAPPPPPPPPSPPPEECSIEPIVSPAPPNYDPCPPSPPPTPPPPPVCESDPELQIPVWFTGNTTEWDGQTGIGIVYYTQTYGYPNETGETFPVGTFVITKIEGGYELSMESDGILQDMSAFYITYNFDSELSK